MGHHRHVAEARGQHLPRLNGTEDLGRVYAITFIVLLVIGIGAGTRIFIVDNQSGRKLAEHNGNY